MAADTGSASSTIKVAAWRNLMEVIQEICDDYQRLTGDYLAAEIVAPTESTLEARTYIGQRGVDHTAASAQPVIFSESRGNLKNALLRYDYSQEATIAIAAGAGEGSARLTSYDYDPTRTGTSVLNVREVFVEDTNANNTSLLTVEARQATWAGRPMRTLTADLVETPGCTRGIHYDYGDKVTVEHRKFTVDVRLDLIHEVVTGSERRSECIMRSVI